MGYFIVRWRPESTISGFVCTCMSGRSQLHCVHIIGCTTIVYEKTPLKYSVYFICIDFHRRYVISAYNDLRTHLFCGADLCSNLMPLMLPTFCFILFDGVIVRLRANSCNSNLERNVLNWPWYLLVYFPLHILQCGQVSDTLIRSTPWQSVQGGSSTNRLKANAPTGTYRSL